MPTTNRILVPIDFSPESQHALDSAITLTQAHGKATLFLFHILPVLPSLGVKVDYVDVDLEYAKKQLEGWRQKIPKNIESFGFCERALLGGDTIARFCRQHEIDLVVMTTRGRWGLPRLLEGSISDDTVRKAPCPVMVLHLNQKVK